jgi:hypothetical protein
MQIKVELGSLWLRDSACKLIQRFTELLHHFYLFIYFYVKGDGNRDLELDRAPTTINLKNPVSKLVVVGSLLHSK